MTELSRSIDHDPEVDERFGEGISVRDSNADREVFVPDDSFVDLDPYLGNGEAEVLIAYVQPPAGDPGDPGYATLVAVPAQDGSAHILNVLCADPLYEVLAAVATQLGRAGTWDVLAALADGDPEVLGLLEGDPLELLDDVQATWEATPPIERVLLASAGAPAEMLSRYESRELAIAIPTGWTADGFSSGEADVCVLVPEGRGPGCISTALQMAAYSETEGQVDAPPIGKIPVPFRSDQVIELILRVENAEGEFTYTHLTTLDPSVFSETELPLVRLPEDLRDVERAVDARESTLPPEVYDAVLLIGNLVLGEELVSNGPISDELGSYRIS